MNKHIVFFATFIAVSSLCCLKSKGQTASSDSTFTMVFMTDIHLQPELNAVEGFRRAIDTINKLKPELVITGGDNIMDALRQKQSRADSLYSLYLQEVGKLEMPIYHSIGNHEPFGILSSGKVDTTNALYGKKIFKQSLGKNFYAIEHKNWKFFVLDPIEYDTAHKLHGQIKQEQIAWIKSELAKTKKNTPIAIVLHVPLLSSISQINNGATAPNSAGLVVENSKQVLDLFKTYNLKLVLQGHLHILEDNYIRGIHFITGGAVCSDMWKGKRDGLEEGFVYLTFEGEKFGWKYVDYGWEPEKARK